MLCSFKLVKSGCSLDTGKYFGLYNIYQSLAFAAIVTLSVICQVLDKHLEN